MAEATRWSQLSDALDALLDLDPAARERELSRIAGTDPAFADELRALLAAEAGSGLLEHGIVAAAPELIASLASDGDAPAGRVIGRWRVLRELGRGGMGEVFLAERADGEFAQAAALKRLKRGMDSAELLRRFAQERRILATLSHPHIARLLDGGIDTDGRPYFVMEHVEGEPITAYACSARLGVRERLQLMQRVCEAVAYAQGRLVVHRDLKPSNILVDARGEPHLLDFGIAKLLADSGDGARTGTGLRVLSPAYAAPEQILGGAISTATDVYALGVLLFELLTGQLPHRRGNSTPEVLAEGLSSETTERPSQCLRRESVDAAMRAYGARATERERFARELAGDLDTIVLTALRREPERRYASAAALGEDLRLYLDGRPISARPDTSGYRLRKFVRRHRVGAVATTAVALAMIAGTSVALWQSRIAQQHAERAERQAQRAEQTKNFVVSLFEQTNPERARLGSKLTALDLIRDAATRIDKEMGDVPESQAELRLAIAESLLALGSVPEAIAMTERALEQLRGLRGDDAIDVAEARHQLAMMYEVVGRMAEARALTESALRTLDLDPANHAQERISARTTLAKLTGLGGDLAGMEALHRQNLDERRALYGPDDSRLAVDWNNVAAVALRRDNYRDAAAGFREAMRLLALNPESPESRFAWLRAGQGVSLIGLGDYDGAERELKAALEIAERTLHAKHPIVGSICQSLSWLARYRQRADEAEAYARRAIDLYAPINHPDQGPVELQLGLALLEQQRDAEAAQVLADAERHFAERRNREEPSYWMSRIALHLARLRGGDSTAHAAMDDALAALTERGHERGNTYAEALHLMAEASKAQHDAAQQREWLLRESRAFDTLFGPTHPRSLVAHKAVARLR